MNEMWILLLLIVISALPVFLAFVFSRARKLPPTFLSRAWMPIIPARWFLTALAAGVASLPIAALIQGGLPPGGSGGVFPAFYNVFFRIAFVEELSRVIVLAPLFAAIHRRRNPDAALCAALGLVAGLGFAMLESAFYGLEDVNIALLRAFTAVPVHGACGIRVGAAVFFFTRRKAEHCANEQVNYQGKALFWKALFLFIFAVFIHGAYNLITATPAFPSFFAVFVAFTALCSSLSFLKASNIKRCGDEGGNV
ncbi:MAG: PrsW family intramembrane metalloprotease [Treponema sp.]|nr:PrsW family intramembrane metalloprotease [Treponema sp.]